ncbi:hypothetical protein SERLADRAFT_439143 [Serpula lacrymans var. lacrymans S7.9]|uniref:Uncharacterized protein n=1 Tax=Serpula lacrymans var. lacrymans (strain S7.9) TaxID=578457 RepID=F8NZ23_SERL9|nr:uncharacterized protein SERLADRAFT_439143 [Serpula lacrymans var. lacrymans S7.9]EGO23843.1 hypothetical protein SERLADRAFT_439143 [Serpula lacrymans var. lacrymans S7.9]
MNRDLVHIGAVLVIGTTVTYIFTQCTTCSARNGMTPAPPMHTVGQNNNMSRLGPMLWLPVFSTMLAAISIISTPSTSLIARVKPNCPPACDF